MAPPIKAPANIPGGPPAMPNLAPNLAPAKPPPAVPIPPIGSPPKNCKPPATRGNLLAPRVLTPIAPLCNIAGVSSPLPVYPAAFAAV